jgi:hypothetical protein
MLRILGNPQRLCDRLSRRDWLQVGGLGALGLTLGDYFRLKEAQATETATGGGFGKAKACILLFLYGSPSQLETFDVKPEAPEGIRGELGTIPTTIPGYRVGELLPNISRVMDKVSVVRSLTHPYPVHGVAYATTGVPAIDPAMELNPRDVRHWPYVGSVATYLNEKRDRERRQVPDNIALPFPFSSQREGEVPRAGPYPSWLGGAYQPHFTEFVGEATRTFTKTLGARQLDVREPYMGITPDSRFTLGPAATLPADITAERFARRRSLLEQLADGRRAVDAAGGPGEFDKHRELAYSLVASDRVGHALDVRQESAPVRDRYGMTLFGQSCLAARRLVEAGSRFVTVFWDEYGLAGSAWDTHSNHYPRMKEELCPGFDRGYAGLITDLDERGLLDETLVLCISEHGRTPKLANVSGGGRDHWSRAYSAVLAGGGVARGAVLGRTDKIASDVQERPVSPKDILATSYHLLGIDPETLLSDRLGRPLALTPNGRVLSEILA